MLIKLSANPQIITNDMAKPPLFLLLLNFFLQFCKPEPRDQSIRARKRLAATEMTLGKQAFTAWQQQKFYFTEAMKFIHLPSFRFRNILHYGLDL